MTRADDMIVLAPAKGTRAILAIDGPASATWNTIVEAAEAYEGGAGNSITLAAAAGNLWVPGVGTLTAAGNATDAVKAELDLDGVTQDLDTIVQAKLGGIAGNDITITVVGDSALAAGVTISEVGNAVTIHFEDGVSTVLDVEAAIGTDSDLIEVKTAGTAATVLDAATDECTEEALASGAEYSVTIGAIKYIFRATPAAAYDVDIGGSASVSLDNLIAAINDTGTAGTTYGTGTVEHTQVRAYAGAGDTMVVHSRPDVTAAVATLIATTDEGAQISWGAATLADGTDGDNVTFAVTGTAITATFASGYSTVEDFEAALRADATVAALLDIDTAGTTPLYLLVVTDDDFTATALAGGGATSVSAPSLTAKSAYTPHPFPSEEALVMVYSVDAATGTTKTATVTLWGWNEATSRGHLIGTLNAGTAIPESKSDAIAYTELLTGIGKFSAFAASLSVGGAGTEVVVAMDFSRSRTV